MASPAENSSANFARRGRGSTSTQLWTSSLTMRSITISRCRRRRARNIRKTIEGLLKGTTWIEFKILHTASNGNVVFNERVDSFEAEGKKISLPVTGVFETTDDGKIKAWRDYFDLKMYTDQLK